MTPLLIVCRIAALVLGFGVGLFGLILLHEAGAHDNPVEGLGAGVITLVGVGLILAGIFA